MERMRWMKPLPALLGVILIAGCTAPVASRDAFITGTARYHERMAVPPNAVFEAVLEEVSRADAPARVLGQQNRSPAGPPPYSLRIPYDPARLDARGRYVVRTSVLVDGTPWFVQEQAAPVLRRPGDTQVDVVLRRVATPVPAGMPSTAPAALQRNWRVTHIGEQALPGGKARGPVLTFERGAARISGNTSCNRFSAGYRLSGSNLRFEPPALTKMACAGSVEPAFLRRLEAVRSYRLQGSALQLFDGQGRLALRLQPAS